MKLSTADLLRAGKSERMRESARAHMADAVAASVLGAAGASAGAGAAAAMSAKTLLTAKAWLVLAMGVVLVGSFAGWRAWTSGPSASALAPSTAVAPLPSSSARSLRVPPPGPLPDASATAVANKPRLDAAPSGRAENETESLIHARERLRAGAPTEALALLAVHSRKFPHGFLVEEARVLRIQALASTDPAKARREAAAFLREFPSSPYRANVTRMTTP
ncbi:MAG: hypothetical protein HOO96_04015 [Polyangiaceae bacterium]|nr:hypothetical protein [Polyangiaceae bacterium]